MTADWDNPVASISLPRWSAALYAVRSGSVGSSGILPLCFGCFSHEKAPKDTKTGALLLSDAGLTAEAARRLRIVTAEGFSGTGYLKFPTQYSLMCAVEWCDIGIIACDLSGLDHEIGEQCISHYPLFIAAQPCLSVITAMPSQLRRVKTHL